jgi:hypothetical protein
MDDTDSRDDLALDDDVKLDLLMTLTDDQDGYDDDIDY